MAFELNQAEAKALTRLVSKLTDARELVEEALLEYGRLLRQARQVRDDVVERLTFEFDVRSQRFQDSRKGEEIAQTIAEWEEMDLDDPDLDLEQAERLEDALPPAKGITEKALAPLSGKQSV